MPKSGLHQWLIKVGYDEAFNSSMATVLLVFSVAIFLNAVIHLRRRASRLLSRGKASLETREDKLWRAATVTPCLFIAITIGVALLNWYALGLSTGTTLPGQLILNEYYKN